MSGQNLDPFRSVISVVTDSDELQNLALAAGLEFDPDLTTNEGYSHKTQVRALKPRILGAYDGLVAAKRLAAAEAAVPALEQSTPQVFELARGRLAAIGWRAEDGHLYPEAPEVVERVFGKGQTWDAYTIIRARIQEAKEEVTIIDRYCDGTVFAMLHHGEHGHLRVKILTSSKSAKALESEAQAFEAQFKGIEVEVRASTAFHDRFIFLDEQRFIHLGASIKDAGKKVCMVKELSDDAIKGALIDAFKKAWSDDRGATDDQAE